MSKDKSFSFGLGLIAGVVGGIVAGIMYAPKAGEESRKEVKEVIDDLSEKYNPELQEAKKQALETVDLAKYKIERQFRKLIHVFNSRKMQKAKEMEDTDYDFN